VSHNSHATIPSPLAAWRCREAASGELDEMIPARIPSGTRHPGAGRMGLMNGPQVLHVDPRTLHLPASRSSGADPAKLHRQIARHGKSAAGMPPIWAYRGTDGELVIFNGVTRATRIAKLSPGTLVPVEVVGDLPTTVRGWPTVGDRLP
jgi:hypothetical protein